MVRSAPPPANQQLVAKVGLPSARGRGGARAVAERGDQKRARLVKFQGPSQLLGGGLRDVGGWPRAPPSAHIREGGREPDTCLPSHRQPAPSPSSPPLHPRWAGLIPGPSVPGGDPPLSRAERRRCCPPGRLRTRELRPLEGAENTPHLTPRLSQRCCLAVCATS